LGSPGAIKVNSDQARQQAERSFKKEQRTQDAGKAMTEYERQAFATREKTAHLKELRLAKEAQARSVIAKQHLRWHDGSSDMSIGLGLGPDGGEDERERRPISFDGVALVFQGGGALGAYEGGVYQAISEANIEVGWVCGASIGAINGALIVGNLAEKRVERLREFWE
jgi:hypothetical protein